MELSLKQKLVEIIFQLIIKMLYNFIVFIRAHTHTHIHERQVDLVRNLFL